MVQSGALFLHSPGRYLLVRHVLVTLLGKLTGHTYIEAAKSTFYVTPSGCRICHWTQSWMRSQSSSSL